jgi:tRNA pseudouridine38-40 synthase
MPRYRLTIEYDGTNYSGWQLQTGQDSIQHQLEAALARLFGSSLRVHGAGRTDAGVHALGQVAAFDAPQPFPPADLPRALNAHLPLDIAVREAAEVSHDFDPRRAARSRLYEYRILNRPLRSALEYRYAWLVREPLDVEAMSRAAAFFLGEQDFAAMRSVGSAEHSTIRRVDRSEWDRAGDARLIYRVEASGFLRHMVRTMVALMVTVGRHRLPPEAVAAILGTRDRALVTGAAPACGLFLRQVRY